MSEQSEQTVGEADDGKVNMNVRIEPNRKAAYKAAAKKSRKSLSEWIRVHLDIAAEAAGIQID
jgi:predicted HicB family RNase H-like nuclease